MDIKMLVEAMSVEEKDRAFLHLKAWHKVYNDVLSKNGELPLEIAALLKPSEEGRIGVIDATKALRDLTGLSLQLCKEAVDLYCKKVLENYVNGEN